MAQRPTLHVTIVTAERRIFDGEAEMVIAPGSEGQLGILPRHAPLLTTLALGEMRIREQGVDESVFVAGGFLEVNNDLVTVLADDAERASTIDEEAAQRARDAARQALQRAEKGGDAEAAAAAELERAVGRLRIAELHRQRHPHRARPPELEREREQP
jgi:F-type H+-transporting ATPase subunit epsilon